MSHSCNLGKPVNSQGWNLCHLFFLPSYRLDFNTVALFQSYWPECLNHKHIYVSPLNLRYCTVLSFHTVDYYLFILFTCSRCVTCILYYVCYLCVFFYIFSFPGRISHSAAVSVPDTRSQWLRVSGFLGAGELCLHVCLLVAVVD